jgi:NADP-dependent 3-hydroxy acid dehydrogenase YdfG
VKATLADAKVDYFIYNVGIWEQEAFSENYYFATCFGKEIMSGIQSNVTSCILSIRSLLVNLRRSENAMVILVGSTRGLENHQGKEVAFSASKFALRGIVYSLKENLRKISLASVSSTLVNWIPTYQIIRREVFPEDKQHLVPASDVIRAIRFITSCSKYSCVKEIDMPAMMDGYV